MMNKIEIPDFLNLTVAAKILDLNIKQMEVWISTGVLEVIDGKHNNRMVKTTSVGKCLMRTGLDGDTVDQMIREAITIS